MTKELFQLFKDASLKSRSLRRVRSLRDHESERADGLGTDAVCFSSWTSSGLWQRLQRKASVSAGRLRRSSYFTETFFIRFVSRCSFENLSL